MSSDVWPADHFHLGEGCPPGLDLDLLIKQPASTPIADPADQARCLLMGHGQTLTRCSHQFCIDHRPTPDRVGTVGSEDPTPSN